MSVSWFRTSVAGMWRLDIIHMVALSDLCDGKVYALRGVWLFPAESGICLQHSGVSEVATRSGAILEVWLRHFDDQDSDHLTS